MSVSNLVPVIQSVHVGLRTSTNYNGRCTQLNCALNFKNVENDFTDASEGWVAKIQDNKQYIIAGSSEPKTYSAIGIQGRGDADEWIKTFTIRYSLDGINWVDYNNGQVFTGNTDRNTVVTHFFTTPFRARSVSVNPQTFNVRVSMRFELYAQPSQHTFTQTGKVVCGANTVLNSTTNTGTREVIVPIVFPVEFSKAPSVELSFYHIDSTSADATGTDVYQQTRLIVSPIEITTKGFKARFQTWRSARAYNLGASYIATITE